MVRILHILHRTYFSYFLLQAVELWFTYYVFPVASNELRGKTDIEKAQVLQWLNYADTDILQAVCTWVFPYLGILDYNKQVRLICFVII